MATRVIILGGGVAGMSAAHELIERGFEVVVLERSDIREERRAASRSSTMAPARADTSSPTPAGRSTTEFQASTGSGSSPASTSTSSTPCAAYRRSTGAPWRITSYRRRVAYPIRQAAILMPSRFPRTASDAGTVLRDILLVFGPLTDLTPDDLALFGARIWQMLTSCYERRLGEYEADELVGFRRR